MDPKENNTIFNSINTETNSVTLNDFQFLTSDIALNSILLLQISPSILKGCVLDTKKNSISFFLSEHRPIQKTGSIGISSDFTEFRQLAFSKFQYNQVLLSVVNHRYTLVPGGIYEENEKENMFYFNFPKEQNRSINSIYIKSLDGYLLFEIENEFQKGLREIFPNSKIIHHCAVLIESLLVLNKNSTGKSVHVHLVDGLLDIIVLDAKNLVLANSNRYETIEDVAYYLLYTLEQLNCNPEHTPVFLLGEAVLNTNLIELLKKYIQSVATKQYSISSLVVPDNSFNPNEHFILSNQYIFKS